MLNPITWLAIVGAIVARTVAAVIYKIAAQQPSRNRVVLFFLLGLAAGFFNPVCVAIAMRGNNPNLIIAAMGGLGGAFFVIVINRVFKERLSRQQWLAIAIIFAGTILLRVGSPPEPKPQDSRAYENPTRDLES